MAGGPRLGFVSLIAALAGAALLVLTWINGLRDGLVIAQAGLKYYEWQILLMLILFTALGIFGRKISREISNLRSEWETLKRTTPGLVPEIQPPLEANMTARQATYYLRDDAKWPDEKGWSRRDRTSVMMASGQISIHAREGHIRSWGRAPASNSEWESIDSVYWKDAELDSEDLSDVNGSSGLTRRNHEGFGRFRKLVEIRFNHGDISTAFPR